jgi:Uma2 family endonuclease
MVTSRRWTSADLETLADDGNLYEIIDGKLFMSTQSYVEHQVASANLTAELVTWNRRSGLGVAIASPGLTLGDSDDVAPDVVWFSHQRFTTAVHQDGKLHLAPELVVELLSPEKENERRDRVAKLELYERHGVEEYWIVDWQQRRIDVFRRVEQALQLAATVGANDVLESSLLPGFSVQVRSCFL